MKKALTFSLILCLIAATAGCGSTAVSEKTTEQSAEVEAASAAEQNEGGDQSGKAEQGEAGKQNGEAEQSEGGDRSGEAEQGEAGKQNDEAEQSEGGDQSGEAEQGEAGKQNDEAEQSEGGDQNSAAGQSAEGKSAAASEGSAGEAGYIPDEDVQLKLIADSSDDWHVDNEYEEYWYAVTDLDRDGNLELIAATLEGSGLYTRFSVYEVNGDRTGLNLLPDTLLQGDSEPDIIVDSAQALEKDGVIYYYFEDVIRISAAEHVVAKDTLSLEDDKIVIRVIASAHTGPELDEKGEPKEDAVFEELFDGEGRRISGEEFDSLTKIPDGCVTIGFGWTELTGGISVKALRESFRAFKKL